MELPHPQSHDDALNCKRFVNDELAAVLSQGVVPAGMDKVCKVGFDQFCFLDELLKTLHQLLCGLLQTSIKTTMMNAVLLLTLGTHAE